MSNSDASFPKAGAKVGALYGIAKIIYKFFPTFFGIFHIFTGIQRVTGREKQRREKKGKEVIHYNILSKRPITFFCPLRAYLKMAVSVILRGAKHLLNTTLA